MTEAEKFRFRLLLGDFEIAHSPWMFLLHLMLAFQDVVFVADNPEMIVTDLAKWDLGHGFTWNDFRHSSE